MEKLNEFSSTYAVLPISKNEGTPQTPKSTHPKGEIILKNSNLDSLDHDHLYHIGLDTMNNNLKEMFSDVKFVCMGGSSERSKHFATQCIKELGIKFPVGFAPIPIGKTERYSMYKVGPVISVSHGMGAPSISILLHELAKMLHYAGAKDVIFMRIGTSGGLGLEPGTVVISEECYNGELEPFFKLSILGKVVKRSSKFDMELAEDIFNQRGEIKAVIGKTMSCDDFYEGQARLDGASCDYSEQQKMEFLKLAHERGVRNIEMEGLQFSAFCGHLGIRAAMLCTVLLNRLEGDQIRSSGEQLAQFTENALTLALRYIKHKLQL